MLVDVVELMFNVGYSRFDVIPFQVLLIVRGSYINLGKKSKPNDFFTRMLYWVPRYTKKNFTAVGPWGNPLYAFNFRYLESRVERI